MIKFTIADKIGPERGSAITMFCVHSGRHTFGPSEDRTHNPNSRPPEVINLSQISLSAK